MHMATMTNHRRYSTQTEASRTGGISAARSAVPCCQAWRRRDLIRLISSLTVPPTPCHQLAGGGGGGGHVWQPPHPPPGRSAAGQSWSARRWDSNDNGRTGEAGFGLCFLTGHGLGIAAPHRSLLLHHPGEDSQQAESCQLHLPHRQPGGHFSAPKKIAIFFSDVDVH